MLSRNRSIFSLCLIAAIAAVACTEPDNSPGSVWVDYATTNVGDELPFTWLFSVDGRNVKSAKSSVTGSVRIDSLTPGSHHVAVSGLPTACTTGADERDIDIPAGDTVHIALTVKCSRTTGDLRLTVTTTGQEQDFTGYLLTLDGTPFAGAGPGSPPILANKLTAGAHTIGISSVASNCTAAGGPSYPITIKAGELTTLAINVACVAVSGTLRVTTTTSGGANADASGYLVKVDTLSLPIGVNSTTSYTVKGGAYNVTLADIEPNCTPDAATKPVTIPVGGTVDVGFAVTCGAYPATTLGVTVADPAADSVPNAPRASGVFDILSMSTGYAPGFMTVTLKFAGNVSGSGLIGLVDFDLDEAVGTGFSPVINSFSGTTPQGVDGEIFFSLSPTPTADFATQTSDRGIRIVAGGDSVLLYIPNEVMGDNGNVTLTAIVGDENRPIDLLPNSGPAIVSHRPAGAGVAMGSVTALRLTGSAAVRRPRPAGWMRPPER